MFQSPPSKTSILSSSNSSLILWCIAVICGIPYLIIAKSQYMEYDGYWNIFIAQQDNWGRFWRDIAVNPHPPLYFLLLKVLLPWGHSLLLYRSITIVSGILSVYLVGIFARRITGSNVRGYQSALAYGLALPTIIMACEVRSYMLSVLFILWSYYYFLEIVQPRDPTRSTAKPRCYFAILAILACLSHYFAFLYCGAALLALSVRFIFSLAQNRMDGWLPRTGVEAATAVPVVTAILTIYTIHARTLSGYIGHLLPFYFNPSGTESVPMFLLRNWRNFLNLFLPFPASRNGAIAFLVAGLIAGVVVAKARLKDQNPDRSATPWTLLVTVAIIAQLAAFSLVGKYPFGGDLRQQYVAFPFLIFYGAIFVEHVAARVGGAFRLPVRTLANAAIIVAAVAVSLVMFQRFPKISGKLLSERIDMFRSVVPEARAVYVDQVNLITFFISHDDWKWSYTPTDVAPGIDVYKLRRDGQEMLLFRDTLEWNVDADQPTVYERLAACLRATGIGDIAVFAVRDANSKPPISNPEAVAKSVPSLASNAGICPVHLIVTSTEWYGDFQESACSPVDAAPQTH